MPRSRPSRTTPEALHALRERLEATQRAAQGLSDDAAEQVRAAREGRPPPAGWDVPRRAEETGDELEALVRVLASLGDLLPPELRAQLGELVRQVLVFVRAVLDWWIDRLERQDTRAAARDDVEDIPIS
jgi:hypothetical protein